MALTLPPGLAYRVIKQVSIAVSTSAVQVDSPANINGVPAFKCIVLFNNNVSGGNPIYFGTSTVTVAHGSGTGGMPVVAQDYWLLQADDAPTFDLWAIAGGSSDLRVLFLA